MAPYLPTTVDLIPNVVLEARQSIQTIGAGGGQSTACSGQYSGGTLAGAILGTFFGTLLLNYLFSTIWNNRARSETVIVEKRRGTRRHRSHSHSGSGSVRRPSRVYSTG